MAESILPRFISSNTSTKFTIMTLTLDSSGKVEGLPSDAKNYYLARTNASRTFNSLLVEIWIPDEEIYVQTYVGSSSNGASCFRYTDMSVAAIYRRSNLSNGVLTYTYGNNDRSAWPDAEAILIVW